LKEWLRVFQEGVEEKNYLIATRDRIDFIFTHIIHKHHRFYNRGEFEHPESGQEGDEEETEDQSLMRS